MITTLRVLGMTCNRCVQHVADALRAVPGVTAVEVDLGAHSAKIAHDERTERPALEAAVVSAGYTTQP